MATFHTVEPDTARFSLAGLFDCEPSLIVHHSSVGIIRLNVAGHGWFECTIGLKGTAECSVRTGHPSRASMRPH